jgi:hypothetical protein
MRGLVLSLSHLSPILLVSLLMLSTHLLWAQRASILEESAVQVPDAPSLVATVSEAQTRLHFTYGRLPLAFESHQAQTQSRMRFFRYYLGYYRLPTANAALYSDTRTAELWRNERYLIGSVPKWPKFAPTYGKVPHETTYRVEDLEHYANNLPWASSIIHRICQQANAHPHVLRVLTVVKPRF